MDEPRIGDTRTINQGKYKENQIFVECPLCHETRWTEMRNGIARYPTCKKHKPTPVTEQAKKNNSIGLKKSYLDPVKKASHALGQKKRYENQEERDKQKARGISFTQNHPEYVETKRADSIKRFSDPIELEKLRDAQLIRWQRPEEKLRSSITHKKLWENPEFADRMLDCIAKGNTHKQTGHEMVLESILNEYFPTLWKYTGNRTVKIGRKFPDFTHTTENLLIEGFGDFWHGAKRLEKLKYNQTVQGRIELFAQYGFKTLVLWEHEILKSPRAKVAERVKEFMDNSKEGGF
jgi:very-short-patch-repair endonuclease